MDKLNLQIKLPVTIIREGKKFVAYTPALDLSTSGKSYNEVKERFKEVVSIFFEEISEAGTLGDVLKDSGWQKLKKQWLPPLVISQETGAVSIPA